MQVKRFISEVFSSLPQCIHCLSHGIGLVSLCILLYDSLLLRFSPSFSTEVSLMAPGKDREKGNKRAGNRQKDRSVEICTEGPASSSQDASNLWSVTKLSGELLINKQQPEKLPLKKRQSLTNIQIKQFGRFLETLKPSKLLSCSVAPEDW